MVWSMVDGGMDYCNQWCIDYVGRPLDQMRGEGWLAALHPHDVAHAQAVWARAATTGEVFEAEFRMCRAAEDRYRWQLVRGVPVRGPDGAILHWFATAVDIHDRREAEGAERAARAEAEAARRTAEAATAAKGRMLAAASHDLRTPLVAIAGYAELLATEVFGPLNPRQHRALQRMDTAQRHLLVLVNDILAAARAEAGGAVPVELADVSLSVVCDELESLVAALATARRLVYRCSVTHGGGSASPFLVVRADGVRVLQILVNLVTNAIKNTEAGGAVLVDATADERRVYIHVRDTGCGIPADQLEGIFEAFVQVGSPASRDGVGLGLAMSRELARRMGGDLVAESTVGVGSKFTLSLPRGGVVQAAVPVSSSA
jgi:PAS domain S-box-containing protein